MLTIQAITHALGEVLTYAETEVETLASCVVEEAETAKTAINTGNEVYRKLHHLTHDPFDLLARVMAASEAGHIQGLRGPLHFAITSTLELAGIPKGGLPQATLPAADAAIVADATPGALQAAVPQSAEGELPEESAGPLVIFSQHEHDASEDGAGFWSNSDGWTRLDSATLFSERITLPVPLADDASWITLAEAKSAASDYRLLIVHGDVEPELSSIIHSSFASVRSEAREYREEDDQDLSDGLYIIKVPQGTPVEVEAFSGGDFDDDDDES